MKTSSGEESKSVMKLLQNPEGHRAILLQK